jgi:hypothetical protein
MNLTLVPSLAFILTLITGVFHLGMYVGSAKFDREKADYYYQIRELQSEINVLREKLENTGVVNTCENKL